jgi:hypothetical protein
MNDNELLAFLNQNQFVACTAYSIPEEGMGSKVDAFSNGSVLLRIVVDRGQRFIDLARAENVSWVDVFKLASKVDPAFHPKTGSFSEAVKTLLKYWDEFVASGLL